MASTVRRAALKQTLKPSKGKDTATDDLANQLASKLKIQGSSRRKPTNEVEEPESKATSMRAVNSASQTLSGVVQSGWKKSTSTAANKVTLQTATSAATLALRHLEILRRIVPDELDVERAAMSVLGKLLVLEMFDLALDLLQSTHPRLLHFAKSPIIESCPFVSIPISSPPPSDATFLTLLATYLAYAPTILTQPHSPASVSNLAAAISSTPQCNFIDWIPYFSLPAKTIDSSLTRIYASLSKLCSSVSGTEAHSLPDDIFIVRIHALKCLVSTSPGTVSPDTFWDQSRRFVGAYVKTTSSSATPETQQRVTIRILSEIEGLIKVSQRRTDTEAFFSPDTSAFVGFCDYWSSFAKRASAGDIILLKRIQGLLTASTPTLAEAPSPGSTTEPDTSKVDSRTYIREGTRYAATFSQAADVFECFVKGEVDIAEVRQAIQDAHRNLTNEKVSIRSTLSVKGTSKDEELDRLNAKVERSIEKLRRAVLRALEAPSTKSSPVDFRRALLELGMAVAGTLRRALLSELDPTSCKDLLSQCLDTVFTVSRNRLDTQDPQTFVSAFDDLSAGASTLDAYHTRWSATASSPSPPSSSSSLQSPSSKPDIDFANLHRCMSGAFYNLGAMLYQAGRVGSSVPFLKESCALADKALKLRLAGAESPEMDQLNDQLYKRWELLGVCYTKNSDRKGAYDAFVQSILTFPFDKLPSSSSSPTSLARLCRTVPPSSLFNDGDGMESSPPPSLKQLASFIDRVTYMGACELLLPPSEVSLSGRLHETLAGRPDLHAVVGVILERQLEMLEQNLWKEGVDRVYWCLLRDLLAVYLRDDQEGHQKKPLRRTRAVLRALDFVYKHTGGEVLESLGYRDVNEMIREVEALCTEKDLGDDAGLAIYAAQYRISALLWTSLFAHRSSVLRTQVPNNDEQTGPVPADEMIDACEKAYALSKDLLSQHQHQPSSSAVSGSKALLRTPPRNSGSSRAIGSTRTATGTAGSRKATGVVVTSRTAKVVASPPSRTLRATRSAAGPPPAPKKAPSARSTTTTSRTWTTARSGATSTSRATRTTTSTATTKGKGKAVATVAEDDEETVEDDRPGPVQPPRTPPPGSRSNRGSIRQSGIAEAAGSDRQRQIVFDDFDKFLALLQLTSRILGISNLILPKAQILDMTRKVAQRRRGQTDDAYISASLDLAYEYVTLGKRKRALSIFTPALEIVRSGKASDDVSVMFLLRFAQSLAYLDDVAKSSAVYLEAYEIYQRLEKGKQKEGSTFQRIHARAKLLEVAASAAHVYAVIQFSRGDLFISLDALLQSLRLFNRAADTLTRLSKPPFPSDSTAAAEADPFQMNALKDALPSTAHEQASQQPALPTTQPVTSSNRRPPSDGTEWRISEGLLTTLFSLSHAYLLRGNPREAEYFIQQALDLVTHVMPVMRSRALARKGEIQILTGQAQEAMQTLTDAANELVESKVGVHGTDLADVQRLLGECQERLSGLRADEGQDGEERDQERDNRAMLKQSLSLLDTLNKSLGQFETVALGPRKSLTSPSGSETLAPELLAKILRKDLWLTKDEVNEEFANSLDTLLALSLSEHEQGERHALVGELTLHSICAQFKSDMFLSSLTESTIAVPMGMTSHAKVGPTVPPPDLLRSLEEAEDHLWEHLHLSAGKGDIIAARNSVLNLALLGAFQASLGLGHENTHRVTASLLDLSAALTLRQNMLDNIEQKIKGTQAFDDLQWPRLAEDGSPLPFAPSNILSFSDSEDEDDGPFVSKKSNQTKFWKQLQERYRSQILDRTLLSSKRIDDLPPNWSVISINISEDRSTLFISKQGHSDPLVFCIPLNERREGEKEEEEPLDFNAAIAELKEIVRLSDESTKVAIHVKPGDDEARIEWWKTRGDLDTRLKQLLENIEYCWLGGFKAILNPEPLLTAAQLQDFQSSLERVFLRCLNVKDKKTAAHRRATSQAQAQVQMATEVSLDENLVRCFSTLSPKCRDEELEDLVYFILDLYQHHGVQVAIAEIDMIQVIVDLRTVLEEHHAKAFKTKPHKPQASSARLPIDEHLFLVLDRNVQGLPWESIPILRGRSVSRIPGIDFLADRLALAKWKTELRAGEFNAADGADIDPCKGFFILNPSGDLSKTEERFREWTKSMQQAGWTGTVGQPVSEQQFVKALNSNDLVVYFGHGGGEQYIRSHKIRTLSSCAATMLWGCSSGALRELGDFDRSGTPYNYMLAGCPTLVANLWDVTDKDIDKFSQSVFDHLGLNGKEILRPRNSKTSIVAAVARSRDTPKLKYLTGAAPVVYGIPFYM